MSAAAAFPALRFPPSRRRRATRASPRPPWSSTSRPARSATRSRAWRRAFAPGLFDRAGRKVTLTAEGQTLAVRVRLSLSLLGDAFDAVAVASARPARHLHACLDRRPLSRPRLPDFQRRFGGIELELRCGSALADLTSDDVDVAIRFGPGGWTGLQARHLGDEFCSRWPALPIAAAIFRARSRRCAIAR